MSTPGKSAYVRKTATESSKPTYNRKKAAMSGSDAKSGYRRKKQEVSSISRKIRAKLRAGV